MSFGWEEFQNNLASYSQDLNERLDVVGQAKEAAAALSMRDRTEGSEILGLALPAALKLTSVLTDADNIRSANSFLNLVRNTYNSAPRSGGGDGIGPEDTELQDVNTTTRDLGTFQNEAFDPDSAPDVPEPGLASADEPAAAATRAIANPTEEPVAETAQATEEVEPEVDAGSGLNAEAQAALNPQLGDTATTTASDAVDAVSGAASDAVNAASGAVDAAGGAVDAVAATASGVADAAGGAIAGAGEAVGGLATAEGVGAALDATGVLAPLGAIVGIGAAIGSLVEGFIHLFEHHHPHPPPAPVLNQAVFQASNVS